jgi:hypothetical protein
VHSEPLYTSLENAIVFRVIAARISAATLYQSPSTACRKSRIVGYHGVVEPQAGQRQSQSACNMTQVCRPNAADKCATIVSGQMHRSSFCSFAAGVTMSGVLISTAPILPTVSATSPLCNEYSRTPGRLKFLSSSGETTRHRSQFPTSHVKPIETKSFFEPSVAQSKAPD